MEEKNHGFLGAGLLDPMQVWFLQKLLHGLFSQELLGMDPKLDRAYFDLPVWQWSRQSQRCYGRMCFVNQKDWWLTVWDKKTLPSAKRRFKVLQTCCGWHSLTSTEGLVCWRGSGFIHFLPLRLKMLETLALRTLIFCLPICSHSSFSFWVFSFSQFFSSLTCRADVYVFFLSYLCFYADLICCNLLFGPLSLQVVAIKFTSLDCCMYREACISTGC